jgi:hypothetical protein
MYIITWSEKIKLNSSDDCNSHKAMTCNKDAAFALFASLTKDIRTIEARIRDDSGNLVSGGFYTQG